MHLVRAGECDALSLGLPEIGRALLCTGPCSHVRVFDAASDQVIAYGPQERAAVLAEIGKFLTSLVAEQASRRQSLSPGPSSRDGAAPGRLGSARHNDMEQDSNALDFRRSHSPE